MTAIVISVVYRSCAIPVAWHILPANRRGEWMTPTLDLLDLLAPAVPDDLTVIVMCDRGLRSPRLYRRICAVGWHPYVRQTLNITFCPDGGTRIGARHLVPAPGYAWIGKGTAFSHPSIRRRGTLIALWEVGQEAPCIVLTDLAPEDAGVNWYGLRFWIETGFRALKGVGWQWQKTRRTDPGAREQALAGTLCGRLCWFWRMEAEWRTRPERGIAPGPPLRAPPKSLWPAHRSASSNQKRVVSVLRQGMNCLSRLLHKGRAVAQGYGLLPEEWPNAPTGLKIIGHPDT